MTDLPYKSDSFDAVICLWTAFHELFAEDEQMSTIWEISRVLKPGGLAMIEGPVWGPATASEIANGMRQGPEHRIVTTEHFGTSSVHFIHDEASYGRLCAAAGIEDYKVYKREWGGRRRLILEIHPNRKQIYAATPKKRSRSPLHIGDLLLLAISVNAFRRPLETSAFRFKIQQETFRVQPAGVPGECAARADHPMAGNHHTQGVRAQCGADRASCLRSVDLPGNLPVRRRAAIAGVVGQIAQHESLERRREHQVDLQCRTPFADQSRYSSN